PTTKQPYRWHGGEPGQIKREDLPYVRGDEAVQFINDAAALLVEQFNFRIVGGRPTNGKDSPTKGRRRPWGGAIQAIKAGVAVHENIVLLSNQIAASGKLSKAECYEFVLGKAMQAPRDPKRMADMPDEVRRAVDWAYDHFDKDPDLDPTAFILGDLPPDAEPP